MMATATTMARRPLDRAWPPVLRGASRLVAEPVLGDRYVSRAAELRRWWERSDAERDAWRADALATILAHAAGHVPAYREVLDPDGSTPLDALPIVDKQTIIAAGDDHLADDRDRYPVVEKHTGGSTGDPWNYPLDRRAWAESYAAQILGFERLGVRYGEKRVFLGFPASLGLQGLGWSKRLRLAMERTDVSLCGFEVDPAASLARAEAACSMGAASWYGYASTIAAMAAAVLDAGRTLEGPRVIVTMAEPLWPRWRAEIEAAFGSTVVEEYGCNDGGIMSHRCAEGNFHLADHQSIVEVLDDDGAPCAPGVDGSITITNLHARHLPFLRYQAGDTGALGPSPCPCGLPGRTLARVSGRSGDLVRLPDGTELVPATFFNPFNESPGVRRWQMVQPDPEHLVVRVEPRPEWCAADERRIHDWIVERTDAQVDVEVTTDEELERTGGGKHRIIVRQF